MKLLQYKGKCIKHLSVKVTMDGEEYYATLSLKPGTNLCDDDLYIGALAHPDYKQMVSDGVLEDQGDYKEPAAAKGPVASDALKRQQSVKEAPKPEKKKKKESAKKSEDKKADELVEVEELVLENSDEPE